MFDILLIIAAAAMQSGGSTSSGKAEAAPVEVPQVQSSEIVMPAFPTPAPPPGPALVAEPQVPTGKFTTAVEVKPILNATRGNWVAVREFNGQDLVYVTHLWSWRCGLLEMRVGVNGAPPEPWPLPMCHEDQPAPNMIADSDGLPYREFGLQSVTTLEVQLTYDDLSTDTGQFDRQSVLIP